MSTNPNLLLAQGYPRPIRPLPVANGGLLSSVVGTPQLPLPPGQGFENDDATAELNRITAPNSEYIQQAEASGLATANSRGLLNSSIAAGAARGAALERAAPLAIATTQARSQRNLTRLDAGFQLQRQTADAASREKIVGQQIASEEARLGRTLTSQEKLAAEANALSRYQSDLQASTNLAVSGNELKSRADLQNQQIAAQRDLTKLELGSRADLQTQQIAAEEARLGRSLTSQEKQAAEANLTNRYQSDLQARTQLTLGANDIAARSELQKQVLASEEARVGRQLTSQESLAALDAANRLSITQLQIQASGQQAQQQIAAEEARLGRQLSSQEKIATLDAASRFAAAKLQTQGALEQQRLQESGANARANLDAATRVQTITQTNLSENQRAQLTYYAETNKLYQGSLDTLYWNKDIPAPARADAVAQFTAIRAANLDIAAATLGSSMNWGTSPPAQPPAQPQAPPVSVLPPAASPAPLASAPPEAYYRPPTSQQFVEPDPYVPPAAAYLPQDYQQSYALPPAAYAQLAAYAPAYAAPAYLPPEVAAAPYADAPPAYAVPEAPSYQQYKRGLLNDYNDPNIDGFGGGFYA